MICKILHIIVLEEVRTFIYIFANESKILNKLITFETTYPMHFINPIYFLSHRLIYDLISIYLVLYMCIINLVLYIL